MNESLRNNPFEAFDWLSEEPEAPVKAKEYVTQSQSVDEAYEAFDWLTEEESPVASPALNQSQSTDEAYEAFDWLDTSSPPPVQEQPTPPEYAVKPPEMPADETLAVDGVPSPRNPFDAPFALALDTGETPAPTTSGPGITSTEPFVPPQSTMPPEMDEALRAQYGKREEGLPLPGIGALLAPVETLGVEGVPIDGIPSQPMTVEQGGPFGGMMPGGGIGDPVPIEQPGLPLPGIGDTAEMAWEIANQAFEKTLGISPKQELKAVTDYGKWLYDTPKRVKEYVTTPGVQRDAPDRSRMGLINDELQAAGDWIGTFGQQLREEPDKPWRVFNLDSKEGKKLVEVDRILSESLTIPMLGTPLEAAESIGIAYMYMGGKPAIKTLKNISFKSPKQTFQDIKWAMDFKGVWQNARNLGPDIRHGAFKDAMFIHNNFPNKLSADRVKYIQNRGRGRPGPPLTAQDQRMIELFKKYPESANYWTKNGFKRPSVIQSILHQKLALPVDPKKESFETTARQQTTFVDPDANKTPKKITVAHRIPSPSEGQLKDRIDRIGDQIVKLGGFDAPQTPQLTQLTGQLSQAQTELAKVVNTSELEANPTVESVSEKMMRNETLNLNEQQVRANNAEKVEELLQAQAIAPGIPIKPPNAPATELSGSTPPIPPTDQVVVGGDMGVGAKAVTDGTRVQPTELDLGKQIAALVKDPRNITKEEWKSPELNKLYNELDPEVWEGAKTTALAIKEESGDIPSRFNVPPDGVSATQDIPTDPFTKFGFKDHVKAVDVKENKKELTKILEGIGEKFNSTGPPSSAAIARKINKFRKSLPEEKYPASSDLARDTEVLPHEIVGIAKDMLKTQASQAGVAMDLRKTGPDLTRVNVRVALKDIIANKDKATKPYTEDVLNLIRGKIYESRGLAEEVDFGEVKQKEKAPYIPFVPQPGIDPKSLSPALDIAMENPMIGKGGLRTVGSKGEYDTLPSAIDLGDFGPKVYGGTTKPDQLAMMLVHAKLLDDGDTSKMGELLKREYAAVKAQRAYNKEREDYGFEYDEWIQNRSYDITGDKLKVGDEFKIFGADNKVIKESEQAVQIKDENGRTTWLPFEGEEGKIRIDKGSLISPEKPVAKPAVSKAPPGELDLGVEKEDITKVIDQKADELVDAASKAGIELNLTEARKQAATIIGRQQASRQTKETGPVSKQGSLNMGTDDLPLFGKPPTQVPPVEGGVTKPVEMYHATETSGPLQISDRNLQHNKYGKGLSVTPHQDLAGRYAEGQEAGSVRKVNVDTGKVFQLDPKPPTILDLGQEAVPTGGFDKDGKTQFAWKKRTLASEDHPDRVSYSDFLRTEKDQFGDNPLLPQITKLGLSKKDLQGLDYSNNRALWDSMVKHFEKQGEKIPAEKARQVIEALGYDSIYHNQGKDEYYNVFKLDKVKPLTPQTTTKPTDITEGSRRLDQAPTTPLAQEALNSLNPTGTVFAKYSPQERMEAELGDNITTLDQTMGKSPDEIITIYRGIQDGQGKIVGGDYVTTNLQLAKDYAGTGKVISKKVKLSDVLDDKTEPLGEEYIYRPQAHTEQGVQQRKETQVKRKLNASDIESTTVTAEKAKLDAESIVSKEKQFTDMISEARRWQGAHILAEKTLDGDKKAIFRVAETSGKSNLDTYLMKKFGVDRATAHDVTNHIQSKNLMPDEKVKLEDFATEGWTKEALDKLGKPAERVVEAKRLNLIEKADKYIQKITGKGQFTLVDPAKLDNKRDEIIAGILAGEYPLRKDSTGVGYLNKALRNEAIRLSKIEGKKESLGDNVENIPAPKTPADIASEKEVGIGEITPERQKAMSDAYRSTFDLVADEKAGREKQIVIAALDKYFEDNGLTELGTESFDKLYKIVQEIKNKGYEKFGLAGGYTKVLSRGQVEALGRDVGLSYIKQVNIAMDPGQVRDRMRYSPNVNADLGYYANLVPSAVELPELVKAAQELTGSTPRVVKKLQKMKWLPSGLFIVNKGTGRIELRADLFKVPGLVERVLGHEVGHGADFIGKIKTLSRGNILGHAAGLTNYTKTLLEEYPGAKPGVLTNNDRARLRYQALKMAKKGGEVKQDVTAEQIKDVWNDVEKAKKNVGLYDYIRGLTREQKVSIIKAALKGKVADFVEFGKIYSTATRTNKQIYQELLRNEIKKRKLYEKEVMMDELKKLTQIWKPFNEIMMGKEYTDIRYAPDELYADAISVLINQPDLLRQVAPTFQKAFMAHMSSRPKVQDIYNRMLERTADAEARFKDRSFDVDEMMKKGQELQKSALNKPADRIKIKTFLREMKLHFMEKNSGIYEKVWDQKRKGVVLDPEKNPTYWLEELPYTSSEVYAMTTDIMRDVKEPMKKAGITLEEMGKYYFWRRATTERKDIANPKGHGSLHTLRDLESWQKEMGEEKWNKMVDLADKDWKLYQKNVLKVLKAADMYSKESMDYFMDNKNYATFKVQRFLEGKHGKEATGRIYSQSGTLEDITNPFVERMMKGMALVRAANIKMAKEKTIKFLQENYDGLVEMAKREKDGKIIPPANKDQKLIQYLHKGKMVGYYVPRQIGEAFETNPFFAGMMGRTMAAVSSPIKKIFVTYNPGWAAMNVQRDLRAWAKQMPEGSLRKAIKYAIKATPHAYKDVFKGESTDLVQRLYRGKALIYGRGYGKHLTDTIDDLNEISKKVTGDEKTYKNKVVKPIMWFLNQLNKIGEMSERVTKIGGALYLDEKFQNMNEKQKMHLIRKRAGSPDFLAGGLNRQISNNAYLFSNVALQGWSAARESWAEDPGGYNRKAFYYDQLPKLVMLAASCGLLGYRQKRLMDKVSEYDKRNYIVIPLYEQENGKVVYVKMPHGFQGQIMGGITWILGRAAQKEFMKEPIASPGISAIPDYIGGQMPYSGLNPLFGVIQDTAQYFYGKNPYNAYYGEKAIPEQVFEAGGWRGAKALAKYEIGNLGYQSLISKFGPRYEGKNLSSLEKISSVPVLGPVIERFIKVSDKGDVEVLKSIAKQVRQTRARENLDIQDVVIDYLSKDKPITKSALKRLYRNMINDGVMTRTESGAVRKSFGEFRQLVEEMQIYSYDNPYLNAYLRARSKEEKMNLLYYMKNWKKFPESVVRRKAESAPVYEEPISKPKANQPPPKKRPKYSIGTNQP